MKKIKVYVATNKVGSTCSGEIEVENNATEEEINDQAWKCICEMIHYRWFEFK